jgi:TrmH family RNA methyltransferase
VGRVTVITSSQNSKIKFVRALLGRAKERREAGAFIIEGVRLVEEAANMNWLFRFVLYDETLNERGKSLIDILKSHGVEIDQISSSLMQDLSQTETPQGILAVILLINLPIPTSPQFIVIADQIRDPGNLGTLLRSAAAAGVQAVIIPPETTDPFSPKVVRAGMGAHFRLAAHSTNWDNIRAYTRGINVFLADTHGNSCWETDLRQPLALIIGSEAEGASEEARELATEKISIPMSGNIESLNAGVAGSVLMFEVVRQRSVSSRQ